MADDWLTIEEAARYLKLSIETVRRYVRTGKLKATRLERQYRINREELDRLLAEGTKPQ